jgi:hypothetical protein
MNNFYMFSMQHLGNRAEHTIQESYWSNYTFSDAEIALFSMLRQSVISVTFACLVAGLCIFFNSNQPVLLDELTDELQSENGRNPLLIQPSTLTAVNVRGDVVTPVPIQVLTPRSSKNEIPYWIRLQKRYLKMLGDQRVQHIPHSTYDWLVGKNHAAGLQNLRPMREASIASAFPNDPHNLISTVSWNDVSKLHSEVPRIQYSKSKAELENEKLARELAAVERSDQHSAPEISVENRYQEQPESHSYSQYDKTVTSSHAAPDTANGQSISQNDANQMRHSHFGWKDIVNMQSVVENIEKQLEATETENALLRQHMTSLQKKGVDRSPSLMPHKLHVAHTLDRTLATNHETMNEQHGYISALRQLSLSLHKNQILGLDLKRKLDAVNRLAGKHLLNTEKSRSKSNQFSASSSSSIAVKLTARQKALIHDAITSTGSKEGSHVKLVSQGAKEKYALGTVKLDASSPLPVHGKSITGGSVESKGGSSLGASNGRSLGMSSLMIRTHQPMTNTVPAQNRNHELSLENAAPEHSQHERVPQTAEIKAPNSIQPNFVHSGQGHTSTNTGNENGATSKVSAKSRYEHPVVSSKQARSNSASTTEAATSHKVQAASAKKSAVSEEEQKVSAIAFRKSSAQIKEQVVKALAADEEASLVADTDAIFGSTPVDEQGDSVQHGFDRLHSLEAKVLTLKPSAKAVSSSRTQELTTVQKQEHGSDHSREPDSRKTSPEVPVHHQQTNPAEPPSKAGKVKFNKNNGESSVSASDKRKVDPRPTLDLAAAKSAKIKEAAKELKAINAELKLGEIKKKALEFVAALERIRGPRKPRSDDAAATESGDVHDTAFRV